MDIPEWEIEETLARNPSLLGVSGRPRELKLIERQKYLKDVDGYIDLLFKKGDRYVIVEIKSTQVDQKSVVINQLLKYRQGLSTELRIPKEDIICVLTTPKEFSDEVKLLCDELGVIARKLDETQIIESIEKISEALQGREVWNKGLTKETDLRLRNLSESIKTIWQDPEYKEKLSEMGKTRWQDPEYVKNVTEKLNLKPNMFEGSVTSSIDKAFLRKCYLSVDETIVFC